MKTIILSLFNQNLCKLELAFHRTSTFSLTNRLLKSENFVLQFNSLELETKKDAMYPLDKTTL